MQDEDKLLEKRALELARRANDGGYYTFSPFLTLAQQSVVSRLEGRLETPLLWLGGYPGAERRLACFGWEDAWGYGPRAPSGPSTSGRKIPSLPGSWGTGTIWAP